MRRLIFLVLALIAGLAIRAWAVNLCAITGVVQLPDGTNCANCVITVNSIKPQTVSNQIINPVLISTTTDASGNLSNFNVAQGLAVQITISTSSGTTSTPFTAIIPFSSTVAFSSLAVQSNVTGSFHLNDLQPPTGSVNMNGQRLINLPTPQATGDAEALGYDLINTQGKVILKGNQTNGSDSINSVNWNGRIDPRTYGAKFDALSYGAGTTTATSTAFSDTTNHPFLPTDCNVTHGGGCTGTADKYIIVYEAAKGTDWSAMIGCTHGLCIQPTTNNAGNTVQCAKQWNTGIGGGVAPTWSQVPGVTTDGTCTWQTSGNVNSVLDTGLPLTTTIVGYISSSAVTLANAAGWSIAGTATYVYGSDVGPGTQLAINAAATLTPNGGGIVVLPCTAGMLATELVMSGQGVELAGCGWGPLESTTGAIGPGLIWAGRTANIPMLRVTAAYKANIHDIRFKGNQSFQSSSVIELCNNGTSKDGASCASSPPNRMDLINNNYFGNRGPFSPVSNPEHDEFASTLTDIQFVGASDNSPMTISNNHFNGFATGAIDEPVSQSVGDVFINNYILSTGGLANWGIRLAGQGVFDGNGILGLNAQGTNVGDTAFDLLNGADAIVSGQVSEQDGRFIVCDMNGLTSMSTVFRTTGKYFQTYKNVTASDGILIDCGAASPGGAVAGQQTITLDDFSITDAPNVNAFGLGWTFNWDTTAGNTTVKADIHSNPLGPINWSQIKATTAANGSIADITLDGIDGTFGPRRLRNMAQGPFGALVYNEEHLNSVQLDAGASFNQLPPPVTGSACVSSPTGAATCKYFVTVTDQNGGESLPSGVMTCAASAVLNSQDNKVHTYIVPGATSYKFWGDNCSGGALNNLLSTTTATAANYTTVGNQITFEDNSVARSAGTPPLLNSTGAIMNPYNVTGLTGYPKNIGDVLSNGHTPGETAFATLPSYANQITNVGSPAVYLRMNDASGNLTDSSGNSNTCVAAGGISYSQTGAITDDPNKAILLNGSTGTCTVASSGTMPAGDTVSCTAWVKFTSIPVTRQMILSQKTGGLQFFLSGTPTVVGTIQLQKDGNQLAGTTTHTISDTNYHFLGFTKNGATTSDVYIDGAKRTQVFTAQTLAPSDATLYVGSQSGSSNFLGATIDEVACYTTALTDAQHASLYKEALTQKYGAIQYDTTNGCFVTYTNGAWGSGQCGVRTVGAGTTQQPTCTASIQGFVETVTDSNVATWGSTLTSGGANVVGGYCDGTNWTVYAK